ncbi:MAG: hypothetical protein ABI566_09810, partial [Pseudolysinimonas sp.]
MSTDAPGGDHARVRPRRVGSSLSIKSLLLLMLLAVSIGSNVVVGVIGYLNGTESLKDAAYDRLIEVRDSRAREVMGLLDSVENSLLLASRDSAVVDAEQAFAAGLTDLVAEGARVLTEEQDAAVSAYFADDFGPALEEATGKPADADSFDPTDPATRYLL